MNGKQLKNSILQWAIQGKLVPQDPNDEPASVLLERIREEKARLVKEGKIKKDKNESIIFRGDDNSHYEKFLATGEVKCIDDEIPFEIPEGWEWCRFGHLVNHSPAVNNDDDALVAFMPMKMIDSGYGSSFSYETKKWKEVKNGFTKLSVGDIAYAKITPCFQNRKSFIFDSSKCKTAAATTELNVVRIYGETISRWYLLYILKSDFFIKDAKYKGTAGQQRVLSSYVHEKLIPVPPFMEQIRIVAKIKEVLPYTDRYEATQIQLERLNSFLYPQLKKSILQEAIQGKLVPQDPHDEPAFALLERIREEKQRLLKEGKLRKRDITGSIIFKGEDNKYYEQIGKEAIDISEDIPFDIPEGWAWSRLRDICYICTGATFKKDEASQNQNGIRILRGGNILPFRISIKEDDIFITHDIVKENILLKRNDIVTPAVTSLENIGKMARIESDMPTTTVGGFVFIIRPHIYDNVTSEYLLSVMSSPTSVEFMRSITNKSGQAFYNIGKERLAMMLVPIPPYSEQKHIIHHIHNLFSKLS